MLKLGKDSALMGTGPTITLVLFLYFQLARFDVMNNTGCYLYAVIFIPPE